MAFLILRINKPVSFSFKISVNKVFVLCSDSSDLISNDVLEISRLFHYFVFKVRNLLFADLKRPYLGRLAKYTTTIT